MKGFGLAAAIAGTVALTGCATVTSEHMPPPADMASLTTAPARTAVPAEPGCGTGSTTATCDTVPGQPAAAAAVKPPVKPPAPPPAPAPEPPPARLAGSDGITYFLPRQLVRVTATRTGGKIDDAVKGWVSTLSDFEGADAKVTAVKVAIKLNDDDILNTPASEADKKAILDRRTKALDAELAAAEADLTKKTKAKEDAKTKLEAAADGKPDPSGKPASAYKVALKLELLAPSGDPHQAFRLNPHHNVFRDDDQKLTITQAGLLSATDITAADRTGDILVELAAFSGAIKPGSFPFVGKSDRRERRAKDCEKAPDQYAGVVDFADGDSVAELNIDLQCLGVRLNPEGKVWPAETRPRPSTDTWYNAIGGIVYRTPVDVKVRIEKCIDPKGACAADDPTWFTAELVALSLPQAGPIAFLRQDAGFLTKSKYALALKDGMLTDYSGSRPSEALEAARLPLRLLNGAADGVAKIISIRTGQNNAQTALATAQLNRLNADIALKAGAVNGKRTLSEAELAALRADYALQAAPIQGQTSLSAAQLAQLQQQYLLQAAPIQGQTSLSAAQLAQIQQQYLLQAAPFQGQTSVFAAQLAALQQQIQLQAAGVTGQTTLSNAELMYALAQNSARGQLSDSDLAVTRTVLRNQYRSAAMTRCIAENTQTGQSIATCFDGF